MGTNTVNNRNTQTSSHRFTEPKHPFEGRYLYQRSVSFAVHPGQFLLNPVSKEDFIPKTANSFGMLKKFVRAFLFCLCLVFLLEVADLLEFSRFQPQPSVSFTAEGPVLSWTRLPYLSAYEVQVFRRPPLDSGSSQPVPKPLKTTVTWNKNLPLGNDYPFTTYWRVSARGLFHRPLGHWSDTVRHYNMTGPFVQLPAQPRPQQLQVAASLAANTDQPILTWTAVPDAVYYEIEFTTRAPEEPNNTSPSRTRVLSSREVFVNGFNPDLRNFRAQRLYWRVRGLDLDGNPVGVFSDAAVLQVGNNSPRLLKPMITSNFNATESVPMLYPVYSWIPLHGIRRYEVELTRVLPENPDTAAPSIHRIWSAQADGFDLYDDTARIEPGRYYFRVRGLSGNNVPASVWSDTSYFDVDPAKAADVATFGDSITHGGGAVSSSPADWNYSYQRYLKFSTYNLGRSSDTAETSAERFDSDVLPFRPQKLIIMTGTNSFRAGVPAASIIRDLATIRDKCLQNGIRPIFLTLPPINPQAIQRVFREPTALNWQDELLAVNEWIREQPYFVDLYPHFVGENGELPAQFAIEGLHYDIEGKKLMAALINAYWEDLSR